MKREIKFRAIINLNEFKIMIDEVDVFFSGGRIGFHVEQFQEAIEAIGWRLTDDYQIEKDGVVIDYDKFGATDNGDGYIVVYDSTYFHLMQYTGLKDKNGVDIYEGDIVTYTVVLGDPNETSAGYYEQRVIQEVYFVDDGFCVDGAPVSAFIENMLVIGNIYQNPELLK